MPYRMPPQHEPRELWLDSWQSPTDRDLSDSRALGRLSCQNSETEPDTRSWEWLLVGHSAVSSHLNLPPLCVRIECGEQHTTQARTKYLSAERYRTQTHTNTHTKHTAESNSATRFFRNVFLYPFGSVASRVMLRTPNEQHHCRGHNHTTNRAICLAFPPCCHILATVNQHQQQQQQRQKRSD